MGPKVSVPFEIRPSLRPVGTFQEGPPYIRVTKIKFDCVYMCCNIKGKQLGEPMFVYIICFLQWQLWNLLQPR